MSGVAVVVATVLGSSAPAAAADPTPSSEPELIGGSGSAASAGEAVEPPPSDPAPSASPELSAEDAAAADDPSVAPPEVPAEDAAARPDTQLPDAELLDPELLELLDTVVVTATKTAQKERDAPAIITVITRDEIRRAGYRSVAEALTMVPGLVVNTDHVFHNVGVRGISGGIRGGSRHIKVLINGQAVAFRPDAQNLLGPELIPIAVIERIEVVRGPASSLYGVNAFLGVVNVITRRPQAEGASTLVRGEAGFIREGPSAGGQVVTAFEEGSFEVLLSGGLAQEDRSGLHLPNQSPSVADYAQNRTSIDDISRPVSLYGIASYDAGALGSLTIDGNFQDHNSRGEWLDSGALSHVTNVHLRHGYVRGAYALDLEPVALRLTGSYARGGPADDDVVLPVIDGRPTSYTVNRLFGYEAINTSGEVQVDYSESSAIVGVEYDVDYEDLRQNIFVSRDGRQTLPGPDFGTQEFNDIGVYGQILMGEIDGLSISGNLRFDHSNSFDDNVNYRVALAWRIDEYFHVKLLSGSSYRAPSPEQLWGTPVRPGGVQGALSASEPIPIEPQSALMHEILGGFTHPNVSILVNGYLATIENRIEYTRRSGDLQVANLADSLTGGFELTLQLRYPGLFELVDLDFRGSLAMQYTTFSPEGTLTPREVELLSLNELYPPWALNWMLDVNFPRWFFTVNFRMVLLGPRLESQSNQSIGRPFVGDPLRDIRPSWPLTITLSTHDLRPFGERETVVQLIVTDVFQTASPEPGFDGINIPSLGRRVFVAVSQEF